MNAIRVKCLKCGFMFRIYRNWTATPSSLIETYCPTCEEPVDAVVIETAVIRDSGVVHRG